ncbi:unnamed protein product [Protopolystoma xenopodis]|uniref:Uncharacterized protein n=1 Tax=Protopolystoma xenopodis TaxID=117903 RepID=A0A3S5C7K1_9PLAT|nr:unnamed protein product [Protopolystoma xenopodis]
MYKKPITKILAFSSSVFVIVSEDSSDAGESAMTPTQHYTSEMGIGKIPHFEQTLEDALKVDTVTCHQRAEHSRVPENNL